MSPKKTICLPTRLDIAMTNLTIWAWRREAKEGLIELSETLLEDPEALKINGDCFTATLPSGRIIRGIINADEVRAVRDEIARERQRESFGYYEEEL